MDVLNGPVFFLNQVEYSSQAIYNWSAIASSSLLSSVSWFTKCSHAVDSSLSFCARDRGQSTVEATENNILAKKSDSAGGMPVTLQILIGGSILASLLERKA